MIMYSSPLILFLHLLGKLDKLINVLRLPLSQGNEATHYHPIVHHGYMELLRNCY